MPRMALASSDVAKLLPSASITATTGAPASRVIEAVMRTLAALTVMTTALELTPASLAMELCRPEVSEKSLTLPDATRVRRAVVN